jgi:hypothetical protein
MEIRGEEAVWAENKKKESGREREQEEDIENV